MSCVKEEQTTLKLLIRLQKELTSKLLQNAKSDSKPALTDLHLTLFSELHELNAPLMKFRMILLIALRLEIAAQLLYLQELIHDYNNFEVCTHHIYLIWQLQNLDK